jgi:shikimate kinase
MQMHINAEVTLVGPGGAGKTTIGTLIAERLGIPFVDLDRRFTEGIGDIGARIKRFGYDAYARENVRLYRSLRGDGITPRVVALSSGFMTYPRDIDDEYARIRHDVERCPTTFVLLPSLDYERCVSETVRRQLMRTFSRSAAREEEVIRERFSLYFGLAATKVATMRPIGVVVDEIVARSNVGLAREASEYHQQNEC